VQAEPESRARQPACRHPPTGPSRRSKRALLAVAIWSAIALRRCLFRSTNASAG
jgi:hypothetical protein